MTTSRRVFISSGLAGLGVLSVMGCARGQVPRGGGVGAGRFAAAARYSAERRGVSLLVMQAGEVLFEDYPSPGGPAKGWELASGTKSFTGIMAAKAVADGLMDLDEPCHLALPEWKTDPLLRKASVRHLLSLTSGVEVGNPTRRPPSYAEAVREAKGVHEPGTVFAYGPEPFQIFGAIMTRKLKAAGISQTPVEWFQTRVLAPIGVSVTDWKGGRSGDRHLPQGAHLTARNWARFGQWVLDGAQGVDRDVYRALFEASAANPGYGLSWWLVRPGVEGPSPRAGFDAEGLTEKTFAEDVVMAAGAGDQRLYLLRKKGLVVARQADKILQGMRPRAKKFSDAEFLELLVG